jgi:hypothetical protein
MMHTVLDVFARSHVRKQGQRLKQVATSTALCREINLLFVIEKSFATGNDPARIGPP